MPKIWEAKDIEPGLKVVDGAGSRYMVGRLIDKGNGQDLVLISLTRGSVYTLLNPTRQGIADNFNANSFYPLAD